jgi:bifunctional DNA-binding transcriptional regulator/antitoxin component of YhaV-PrlF toxin-antitoxin module
MNTKNSWVLEVQEDPENPDELMLQFPDEVLEQAGWKAGDTLIWKDLGNGSWSLTRKLSTKERAQALYIQARDFLLSFKSKP